MFYAYVSIAFNNDVHDYKNDDDDNNNKSNSLSLSPNSEYVLSNAGEAQTHDKIVTRYTRNCGPG
jgi:hypothetical protein